MLSKHLAAIAAAAFLCAGSAEAGYIVDTGPGTGLFSLSLNNQGVSYQNLGVTFNVGEDSSLTGVEGWITGVGSLLFELHQGASPTGALLFSSLVTFNDALGSNWYGATGLDWDVLAGDYTLTVIAQPGFIGAMQTGVANPAGTEWFAHPLPELGHDGHQHGLAHRRHRRSGARTRHARPSRPRPRRTRLHPPPQALVARSLRRTRLRGGFCFSVFAAVCRLSIFRARPIRQALIRSASTCPDRSPQIIWPCWRCTTQSSGPIARSTSCCQPLQPHLADRALPSGDDACNWSSR